MTPESAKHRRRTKILRIGLPIAVLAVGAATTAVLVLTRPAAETQARAIPAPLVRVHVVTLQDLQLTVHSQGTVEPRTRTALVSQVAGRIVRVAASFESGGFFDAGETLLTIDPTDFELAVVRARAAVAQAEVRVAMEGAEAAAARREWEAMGSGEANPLVLRQPQVLDAAAALEAARAALRQAEIDLERTQISVPFPGRVSRKDADVGQYVPRGAALGEVYAIDYAEVRLPVPDDELAFFSAGVVAAAEPNATRFRNADARVGTDGAPSLVLRARFAGAMREWQGHVARTEGEIDPRTRMLHIVARVPDPYGRLQERDAPLAAGLFVEAEIAGNRVRNVVVLPRAALRGRDQVLVVDDDDRLRFRSVDILRAEPEEVIVRSGLRDGERVLLSPLEAVTDGMRVRTATREPGAEATP